MRLRSVALTAGACLLLSAVALGQEEISLKNGTTGFAEVLETSVDMIKVRAQGKERGEAIIPIKVQMLEPHCYYSVRAKYMEPTAENHIALAKFCIDHEMFTQAQFQIQQARAVDPEYVEKLVQVPGVREGVARKLLSYAREQLDKGNADEARKWVTLVIAKAGDTDVADEAEALLDTIEAAEHQADAEAEQARQQALEQEQDEAVKEAHRERDRKLDPLRTALKKVDGLVSEGMRERNNSRAKKMLKEAAAGYDKILRTIGELEAAEPQLGPELTDLEAEAKDGGVNALVSAGGIAMARGSFNEAEALAREALAFDPDSGKAQSFLEQVQTTAAISGSDDRRMIPRR